MLIPQEAPAIIHVIKRPRRVPKLRFIRALGSIFGKRFGKSEVKRLTAYQVDKLARVISNDIPNPIPPSHIAAYNEIGAPTVIKVPEPQCAYTRIVHERVGALIAYNIQVDGKKVTMVGYSIVHAKDRGKFSVSTAIENGVKNAVTLEEFFHTDFFVKRNVVSRVLLAEIPQFRKRVERYFRLNINNNSDGSVTVIHRVETSCAIPAV